MISDGRYRPDRKISNIYQNFYLSKETLQDILRIFFEFMNSREWHGMTILSMDVQLFLSGQPIIFNDVSASDAYDIFHTVYNMLESHGITSRKAYQRFSVLIDGLAGYSPIDQTNVSKISGDNNYATIIFHLENLRGDKDVESRISADLDNQRTEMPEEMLPEFNDINDFNVSRDDYGYLKRLLDDVRTETIADRQARTEHELINPDDAINDEEDRQMLIHLLEHENLTNHQATKLNKKKIPLSSLPAVKNRKRNKPQRLGYGRISYAYIGGLILKHEKELLKQIQLELNNVNNNVNHSNSKTTN